MEREENKDLSISKQFNDTCDTRLIFGYHVARDVIITQARDK